MVKILEGDDDIKHLSWLKVTKLHAQKHSHHPIVNISSPQHFDLKGTVAREKFQTETVEV